MTCLLTDTCRIITAQFRLFIQVKCATTLRIAAAIRHAHVEMPPLGFVDWCVALLTHCRMFCLSFGFGTVCWTMFDNWKNFALCLESCLLKSLDARCQALRLQCVIGWTFQPARVWKQVLVQAKHISNLAYWATVIAVQQNEGCMLLSLCHYTRITAQDVAASFRLLL